MAEGVGEQEVVREPTAIRAARASQKLRTSRDYVPGDEACGADGLTTLLIADRKPAWRPLNYAIGCGGELAKW
jgi:hypothetical protein